jgi:predicted O-methyltransferase YrrM
MIKRRAGNVDGDSGRPIAKTYGSQSMDAVERIQVVLDRSLGEGSVVSRLDGSIHDVYPVAIGRAEGEALAGFVQRERATDTIEIGLGYGISTLFICRALVTAGEHVHHVALDPNQSARFANCALQVLEDAGVSDIAEHVPEPSEVALPRFLEQGRRFDFAFVDGNHRFDGVFLDLAYLGRLLKPGRMIFVDDYQLPGVRRAVSFFVSNLRWTVESVSTEEPRHHWAAIRTETMPDERAYDYFVDF